MRARLLAPDPALAIWIEHFWIQSDRAPAPHRPWRIVPDASAHLIFSIELMRDGREQARFLVIGSRATYADINVARRILTIGARLRPGALPALVRSDAREFTGRAFRLEDVFGAQGRDLMTRMDLSAPEDGLIHLSAFLAGRFADSRKNFELPAMIRCARSPASFAGMMNLSPRGARNRVIAETGLGPRRLLRIARLHRTLHQIATGGFAWADIAYQTGYADQAHMVREFLALLGDSPTRWRARSAAESFNTGAGHLRQI